MPSYLMRGCIQLCPRVASHVYQRRSPTRPPERRRKRRGTVPALVEEQAVKSRLFDLPLSSGLSPFLLFGCCFHERDAYTPRARLHRPESPSRIRMGDAALENGATLAALLATMAGTPAWVSRPLSPYRSRPCGCAYPNHSEGVQECRRGVLF